MPTTTFNITTDDNDGSIYAPHGTSWATLIGGGGEFFTSDNFGSSILGMDASYAGYYYISNPLLRFDTSSIPAAATITSANLKIYVEYEASPDNLTWAADFYDYGGSPAVQADWEATSSGNAIASLTVADVTLNTVNTVALTGLAGIQKDTGAITGLRFGLTSTATTPTGDNYIAFSGFASANQEPRLEVTYSAGGSDATIALTGYRASGTASVVAPPRPRPAHPYSEINLRM
jgi:hypothetical protein